MFYFEFSAFVATLWLALRLNMISVVMVTSVSFLAVIEHNYSSVNPGMWFFKFTVNTHSHTAY